MKKLLIINSFNEYDPWFNSLSQPLVLKAAENDKLACEIVNINNALLTDSTEFINMVQMTMAQYEERHPDMVVMYGGLAFDFRDAIQQNWGDVPMLLVTSIRDYFSVKDFFSNESAFLNKNTHYQLTKLKNDYNFTAIVMPELYKPTVDMMVNLIPDMDNFVFMSDNIYINRRLAYEIQEYLKEEYPNISFSWLKANTKNADIFRLNLIERKPKTGFLLSTWLYDKRSISGVKIPTSSDLMLLSGSHNPIFSLHEAYITYGVVGGVYPSSEDVKEHELALLDSMLCGKSLKNIPIYVCEESYPLINYRKLKEYGLSESKCPKDTVYYSKPLTFWEKYIWQFIVFTLIAVGFVFWMIKKNLDQREKISALNRNKEFVNNMPIPYSTATVRYDTDNQVVTIAYTVKNEAFNKILQDNAMKDSPFLLFPASFIAPKVKELLKTKKMQMFTYHFDKTDKYYDFILCFVHTSLNSKDKNVRMIDVFARDVTKRHKNEVELTKAMHKLDLTLSVTDMIPWEYNVHTDTITYDEHASEAKVNYSIINADETEHRLEEFLEYVYPDDRKKILEIVRALREGRCIPFKLQFRRYVNVEKTRMLWFEMNGAVTEYDDEGKPLIVTGSSQNVNDMVMHQQELTKALDKANESDRMKSAFLASMSHEIRTPLNAIVGFSNVIAHTEDEKERLEFCEIINRNNDQLLSLINDVLDLAKIESNTIDINYEECDLNAMLEQVEKTMSIKVPAGVKLNVLPGRNKCIVEIDQTRVIQVLNNLISNSCKFTMQGNISFGYNITDYGMIYFYVRDTGIGISKENQEKVFDRFFKLDTFVPGTGLGLSICKNLVEKMGGEIGVESAGENRGSMFWFTIPYAPVETDVESQIGEEGFFKKRLPDLNRKLKVLIAEDNESNYRLLAHLLKNSFEIIRAKNGEEAVQQYLTTKPDVILMDISMPGKDGYEAFKEIRKLTKKVPIIAVTAYVYASDKSKILEYGFDGYVSKPITQKSILDSIGHALA